MASVSSKYTMEQFNIAVGITRDYGVSLPTVTKLYEHFASKYSNYSDEQLYNEVKKIVKNPKELSKLEKELGIENNSTSLENITNKERSTISDLTKTLDEVAERIRKNTEIMSRKNSRLGT